MPKTVLLTALAPFLLANAAPSPWNGLWRLDAARSSPGTEGAPITYRLAVGPNGRLRWEIPSLDEVVVGRLDGKPMPVRRAKPSRGLTLAVRAVMPGEWIYQVARKGHADGGGRMMLVDDATAWVDLTWGRDGPGHGVELVYRKVGSER